jgi:hypothetical protein
MKFLKRYNDYLESLEINLLLVDIDLNESLNLFYENILQSIGAEEVDVFDTFKLSKDDSSYKTDLEVVNSNPSFISSLSSIGLKNSSLQSTDDLETFVNKPCRFVMVYRIEANELENPNFILFQSWNDTIDKWDDIKTYKITGDIKSFYDKLASKVIEITHDDQNYIYQSSNKNEWILQNVDKANDTFKKYFRKEDFEKFINANKFRFDIK